MAQVCVEKQSVRSDISREPERKQYGAAFVLFLFGLSVTVILLTLGFILRSADQNSRRHNQGYMFDFPISVKSIRTHGNHISRAINKTVTSPLFIVGLTVAFFALASGVMLYYLYPILTRLHHQDFDFEPQPQIVVVHTKEEDSNLSVVHSIVSELLYTVVLLCFFAAALYIFSRFGANSSFPVVLGISGVLVLIMFLLVRFQRQIIPFVAYCVKKTVLSIAHSAIDCISP